jgi:hypothetical protein
MKQQRLKLTGAPLFPPLPVIRERVGVRVHRGFAPCFLTVRQSPIINHHQL